MPLPQETLKKAADSNKRSFDNIKASALSNHRDKIESDPTTWTEWKDIPPRDCLTLIKLIKEKAKEKK